MKRHFLYLTPLGFLLFPGKAFAHLVNQDVGEFYAGMLHPLTSAEHLLPVVALALLAGRQGIRGARWAVFIFPLALILGTLLLGTLIRDTGGGSGVSALPVPSHLANLAAIVVLGVLLAGFGNLPLAAVVMLAGVTGLVLGLRSGIDMANAGVGVQFIPGVGLTGFILTTLGAAWIAHGGWKGMRTALSVMGALVALAGLLMLGSFVLNDGASAFRSIGLPTQESLLALVKQKTLTFPVVAGSFLAAMAWGASHALTPGHGKAIAGAYLIGSRGTALHAVYLGLAVTATHTIGVFAMGLVALFASRYLLPEQLTPWLAAASGIIIVVIGVSLFWKRLKPMLRGGPQADRHPHGHDHHLHDHGNENDHDHPHSHSHDHDTHAHLPPGADGAAVTWRSLLGLGISGGLLPCPAALVLLLTAISFGRTVLGLLLVIAFSFGLASVLTVVGLLFIKGSRLLNDATAGHVLRRYAPALSALVILTIGIFITAGALSLLMS